MKFGFGLNRFSSIAAHNMASVRNCGKRTTDNRENESFGANSSSTNEWIGEVKDDLSIFHTLQNSL